jgi:prepilin signal peptidase PulO-like enzyme (type II secretory pathway)
MVELTFSLYLFILGLTLGSFLNVIIYRTHKDEPWWNGRSRCPKCKSCLSWKELIPVLSYIFQKGRCKTCGKVISVQYPLMELATGSMLAYIGYRYGITFETFILGFLALFLLGNFVSDLKYMELPDIFSMPSILLALIYQTIYGNESYISIISAMLFGAAFFILQYVFTKGKGIGTGDIRLGVLTGALLGWPLALYSIMLAYVGGSIVAMILLISKKMNMKSALPLGVFLIPALVITFLYSSEISFVISNLMYFDIY